VTNESRPKAAPGSVVAVPSIAEATCARTLDAQVSHYCATCRRHLFDEGAAAQHVRRGHLVETTTSSTTVTGRAADVDRRIAGRWGWGA